MIRPGDFDFDDFRPKSNPSVTTDPSSRLRVCQWNIERGYQITRIIDELIKLDCDIIALQEIDVGCERSGLIDSGRMIARALSMNYVYLCEFIEIRSDKRSPLLQGGGHHGHAILTKYDISHFSHVQHLCQPVDWETEGLQRGEPRVGKRVSMKVAIRVPCSKLSLSEQSNDQSNNQSNNQSNDQSNNGSNNHSEAVSDEFVDVLIYNAHFEVFCGIRDRLQILSDLFDDSRHSIKQYPYQIIAMDANTMAHSIARLSSKYCCDEERYLSLGWTESEIWGKYVLNFFDHDGPTNEALRRFLPSSNQSNNQTNNQTINQSIKQTNGQSNKKSNKQSNGDSLLARCRNPGFVEPFDVYSDVTLYNHHGLFQAKLDWLMIYGLQVQSKTMGNHDYKASDHKWLMVELNLLKTDFSKRVRSQHGKLTRWSPGVLTFGSGPFWGLLAWSLIGLIMAFFISFVRE